ncbi:ATP-binding cassette domain-containing protein [Ktedonosporobacter rubrisoli]|uniref:ATP-binding cassette domain-containing protein n=1 Tax=Ktedonosporobacter rubrisoli TaxID=2509675 RepID=A0A4P6K240_KTERU|nr:ABC transporter transmembrane domain-containing protein [Ktedonosporobacter rubrisoli]QBD82189.1 ATP-binding cassette domain-containing protein [Ktedonosporobacter rubrisoli]
MLFRFLYQNLKGYRFLVVLAIIVTISQTGSDLLAVMPLKFITSKISNSAVDPACQYPFLDPILSIFDTPALDSSLQPSPGSTQAKTPPTLPCPVSNKSSIMGSVSRAASTHHSVIGVIVFSVLMLLFFSITSALLAYVDLFLASYIAQNLSARLRNQLFEHLQRLSLDWHGKQKKGDLVQRVTGNIADIEKLITDGLVDLLGGILTLIGVAFIMYITSASYTVLSLVIAPALFMIVLSYTKNIKAASKKASKAAGQVADVATEDINALTVIKVFTREEREGIRFGSYVDKNRKAGLLAGGLQAQFTPIVSILVAIGTAIVVGVGGYVAAGNTFNVLGIFTIDTASGVDIGTLILFLSYLKMLYQPMRDLSKLTNLASSAASGAERIQEVLDQAPEVIDSTVPYTGPQKLRGEITFDNVYFGYTQDRLILKGINLHIPAGRKVALVGLSGGGKTTLVKLIPRFYEIQQGSVRVDGVDNRAYPLRVLRENVSMVLQDSVLFEGTIKENIEVGRPGASMEEIIDAARKANIHDVIINVLGGYDRLVREQGKDLSGGQRQRMAIARAILRDAPILILDEPTASLDVESEAEVMHALDQLVVGRTVLMISHRLSTLGNVDEIIVLKDGRIVEQGSYKELKRSGGVFASLLEEQNRYNIEKIGEKSIIRSAYVTVPPVVMPSQRQVPLPPAIPATPDYRSAIPGRSAQQAFIQSQGSGPFQQNGKQQGQYMQQPAVPPHNARVMIELDGKVIGERPLNKPILTVGRLAGNDVQIPNQRVSRLHAKILQENGTWVIEDADSVNGLVYQGSRVERHVLSEGDRVYIAPTAVLHYKANA